MNRIFKLESAKKLCLWLMIVNIPISFYFFIGLLDYADNIFAQMVFLLCIIMISISGVSFVLLRIMQYIEQMNEFAVNRYVDTKKSISEINCNSITKDSIESSNN